MRSLKRIWFILYFAQESVVFFFFFLIEISDLSWCLIDYQYFTLRCSTIYQCVGLVFAST
jgi:hypothetical protein